MSIMILIVIIMITHLYDVIVNGLRVGGWGSTMLVAHLAEDFLKSIWSCFALETDSDSQKQKEADKARQKQTEAR